MFKGQTFYHQHIRKAIIAFGTIFNNIVIERRNASNEIVQSIRVPLSYSPKQKFLARIDAVSTANPAEAAITLPRIGFEITGLTYNPSRKISLLTKNRAVGEGDSPNQLRTQFTSTPYDLTISMFVMAKNQDDGLQIIEQILPFFNPDFNVTINDIPEMGIKRDLKINLDGVSFTDDYAGDYTQRRTLIWDLNFTLGLNFYGPVTKQGIIRTAIATAFDDPRLLSGSNSDTEVGRRYTVTTDPADATPETGEWDYIETFEDVFGNE